MQAGAWRESNTSKEEEEKREDPDELTEKNELK